MALMPKVFLEAEGMDDHFPSPSTHRGGDLSAEQRSRGPADEDIHLLGVEDATNEPLPTRHCLDLIETPRDRVLAPQCREAAVILLQQRAEVARFESSKLLVLEVNVGQALAGDAASQPLPAYLVEEGGLARTAHADHRRSLVRQGDSSVNSARRTRRQGADERIRKLVSKPGAKRSRNLLIHWDIILLLAGRI